jgi:hypothetical protein
MLTIQSKVAPHPEVVHTALKNGDSVLLHLGTQTYLSLNQTGSAIWGLLEKGLPLGEIGQALQARYEVSLEQAQQSVMRLVEELAAERLVILSDEGA